MFELFPWLAALRERLTSVRVVLGRGRSQRVDRMLDLPVPSGLFPLGHVPKVRPYRRAGYVPATVGSADNRGIGDCQRW